MEQSGSVKEVKGKNKEGSWLFSLNFVLSLQIKRENEPRTPQENQPLRLTKRNERREARVCLIEEKQRRGTAKCFCV